MSVSFSNTAIQIARRDRGLVYGTRRTDDLGDLGFLANKKMLYDAINNNATIGAPLTDTEVANLTTYYNSLELNF